MAGKAPEALPGDRASYQNMQHNLEKEFDEALRRELTHFICCSVG